HRAPRLRLPGRRDDPRVGAGEGLGVRRHDRARCLESVRYAARDPDIRHLESAADGRRTRADQDRDRDLRALLRTPGREPWMSLRGGAGWILPLGVIGCVLPAAGTAQSTTAASELARCASIAAATERLTCYDAHVCAVIPGTEDRLACYDALTPPTAPQPTGAQPESPPAAGTAPATPPAAPPP